jgi:acetyl-CoA hydrolase
MGWTRDQSLAILFAVTVDLTTHIRSGDTVLVGQASGEPPALVEALIEQRHAIGPMTVFVGATNSRRWQPEQTDVLRFIGYGAIGRTATLSRAGVLDVVPAHLGSLPHLITSRAIPIDVVLCQVSPPDDAGYHSLGLVTDYLPAAIAAARTIIAEVNPHVPYTFGETIDSNDARLVPVADDRPLPSVKRRPPSEEDRAIAAQVAALVPDGATIQFGVGGTPDAVLDAFAEKHHLGVHSGLISDAVLDLIEAGVVTNANKPIDTGLTVTGCIVGTERLYHWAHRNPTLLMRPVSYTHNPRVLSEFDNFFAINGAVEVDLSGQINAEMVNGTYVGAVGGHGAFARAGASAVSGRSIIVLPATAASGTVSRIVARLGDAVTSTPRADADIVVTEQGVADLRGATLRQRAERLIAIAGPPHRDALREASPGLRPSNRTSGDRGRPPTP